MSGNSQVQRFDLLDAAPWTTRTISFDPNGSQIGDIREYDFAQQWWTNHTLNIGHLELIGEGEAVSTTAEMQRMAIHGFATPAGSPGMLSYEPQFGSAFDMSAGQFNVAWTPFNGAPTVGISDLSGGTFDTPQITSFFGGNPTGIDFNDPSLLMSISLDGWENVTWEPLVLDLDGNGAEIRPRPDSTVYFDVDGDGAKERTAWAGPNDGLLVIDLAAGGGQGADGQVTQALELAFARWTGSPDDTDAEALRAAFDSNGNGLLDGGDARWGEFRVWRDQNQNGTSEAGELLTFAALGITSFSLSTDKHAFTLPDGTRVHGGGSFVRNGAARTYLDAALAYDEIGFRRVEQPYGFDYVGEDGSVQRFWTSYANARPASGISGGFIHPVIGESSYADGFIGRDTTADWFSATGSRGVTIASGGGVDNISGSNGNDVLDGGPGPDTILGNSGDDTIFYDSSDGNVHGGDGYDTAILTSTGAVTVSLANGGMEAFIANQGNDAITANPYAPAFIDGRAGNDTIYGSPQGDVLVGGPGNDAVYAGDGGDLLQGGSGADVLYGQGGDDVAFGGAGVDFLSGESGDDVLRGGEGADTIDGGLGNDLLDGGDGADTMAGGTGDDTYSVDNGGDVVAEGAGEGNDTVHATVATVLGAAVENLVLEGAGEVYGIGNDASNRITGNSGHNHLIGGAGADTLDGGGGGDDLDGGAGADALFGGSGFDYARHDSAAIGVYANLLDASVNNGDAAGDSYSSIEGLVGSAHADILAGDHGANVLFGMAGNDALVGNGGADMMAGGPGDDVYFVDEAGDAVVESAGEGNDTVYATVGYAIPDTVENLTLGGAGEIYGVGNDASNRIAGNAGHNHLIGGGRADALDGGGGDDDLDGGAGGDALFGGSGFDYARHDSAPVGVYANLLDPSVNNGDAAGDSYSSIEGLVGSAQADVLAGDHGANALFGMAGNDALVGNGGADSLAGGAGDDLLVGGAGDDALDGEAGNDVFAFYAGFGHDTVAGFAAGAGPGDVIEFHDGLFAGFADVLAHAAQTGSSVTITHDPANAIVLANTTLASLQADDFRFA